MSLLTNEMESISLYIEYQNQLLNECNNAIKYMNSNEKRISGKRKNN